VSPCVGPARADLACGRSDSCPPSWRHPAPGAGARALLEALLSAGAGAGEEPIREAPEATLAPSALREGAAADL